MRGAVGRRPARLGVRILVPRCVAPCSPADEVTLYKSTIARHVDAIVSDGYDPALTPTFRKVRKAGILLISSGDDIAGERDLWVGPSDPVAYGQALADALASQIGKEGEYAILDEQGEFPIAKAWKKVVEDYIPKAYPKMKLDGALTETGAGDPAEVDSVKSFMAAHPNLKGLIGIAPTETYMAGEAITQAGRIGQVFSAGNGGASLADPQLRRLRPKRRRRARLHRQPEQARLPHSLGGRTTCSPATTSGPAPTRSAARSASSTTTPSTRSCGSASR